MVKTKDSSIKIMNKEKKTSSQLIPSSPRLDALERALKTKLKKEGLQNKTLLLAISGGFDSMLLLHLFSRLKKPLSLKLYAAHVHHGYNSGSQGVFRDKAWRKVKKEALKRNLPFLSNLKNINLKLSHRTKLKNKTSILKKEAYDFEISPQGLRKNEESYRHFRYFCLRKFKKKTKSHFITLAHFSDDLLETRLMRLIRGTGKNGLKAMKMKEKDLLRPLLEKRREEFLNYAEKWPISFVKDPSNRDVSFLRNWLRLKILPALEKKRSGTLKCLSRSLENLSLESETWNPASLIQRHGISFPLFLELSKEQKISLLSFYMRTLNMKNYTLNHIQEILKRLKTSRNKIQFKVLKHEWKINSKYIKAIKIESVN